MKNYGAKEKGINKESKGKHKEYYSALIDNKERIVEESRIQKVGSCMATIKIIKRSLSNFDDKRFYVNNIKSYPLDENMYLFKRDLVNKICERTSSVASQAGWGTKDYVPSMINDIKELTIDSNRKLIDAAIIIYNELL